MKNLKGSLVLLVAGIAATACVTAPVGPGAAEGAQPPMLTVTNGVTGWDNPAAFGPVPASQRASGERTCALLNNDRYQYTPTGYHSRARGVDGRSFPNGGFYCVQVR